jgi:hypothetical protein
MKRVPDDASPIAMAFPDLDTAESALDWIGLQATEGGDETTAWFEGELDDDAADLLEAAYTDRDAPGEVRALAAVLREQWLDDAAATGWRITFPAGG